MNSRTVYTRGAYQIIVFRPIHTILEFLVADLQFLSDPSVVLELAVHYCCSGIIVGEGRDCRSRGLVLG